MDANTPRRPVTTTRICRQVRAQLCGTPAAAGPAASHLDTCPDCAAFARRLELAREALRRPLAAPAIEPDGSFRARVLARLARPSDLLGWAAYRALPAALGLALALAGVGWMGWLGYPPAPAALAATPAPSSPLLDEPPSSDQLLAWSSLSPEVWP